MEITKAEKEEIDIALNYVMLVGLVHRNTPWCVLKEIAQSIFKGDFSQIPTEQQLDYIIYKINGHHSYHIKRNNIKESDLPHIARFINGNVYWDEKTLLEALDFLSSFYIQKECNIEFTSNMSIGPPTPLHPRSLSSCILYRLCHFYQIPTSFQTSIESMALTVRFFMDPLLTGDIRKTLKTCVRQAPRETLIKMFATLPMNLIGSHNTLMQTLPPHTDIDMKKLSPTHKTTPIDKYPKDPITFDGLVDAWRHINETVKNEVKLENYQPISQCEAVVLSAQRFLLDLSRSKNPMAEYESLSVSSDISKKPIFLDPLLGKEWDEDLLCLRKTFNPFFPVELYTEEQVRDLAIHYGYLESDLRHQSGYELLQLSCLSNHFHPGSISSYCTITMEKRKTPITRESIDSFTFDQLVSFCFAPYTSMTMSASSFICSYQELADFFSHKKNFLHPVDPNLTFDPIQIRRLQKLCQMSYKHETEEGKVGRAALLYAITLVELFQENSNERCRDLFTLYQTSSAEQKQEIRSCVDSLFRLAMSLRGWLNREGEIYPIEQAPVDNQDEVDEFVNICLGDLDKLVQQLKEKTHFDLYQMPLLLFRNGEYIFSSSERSGLTIGQRIEIIHKGDHDESMESCIRRSSNWLTSSACRCYEIIGILAPIDIHKLREIS